MIIEIVGNNQTFFRRITQKHWKAIVASAPTDGWTIYQLNRLHKLVWARSKPARIDSTGAVEATVIDSDDIVSSEQSWEENHETLIDECEHKQAFEYEDRRGEPHLGCKDCGSTDV